MTERWPPNEPIDLAKVLTGLSDSSETVNELLRRFVAFRETQHYDNQVDVVEPLTNAAD